MNGHDRIQQKGVQTLARLGKLRMPSMTNPAGVRGPTFQGARPNVAVGALIVSPGEVREKMDSVNTQVNTLDSEIKTNVTRPAFLSTWGEFRSNWQKFYDDHQSTAKILFTGTGTLDRKANEYQSQLSNWYSALKQENPQAKLVFPPPLPATAPPTGPSVSWWGISLLTLLGTGALAYMSYASYLYIKQAQAKKKFIEEEVVPIVLAHSGVPGTGLTGKHLASAFNQSRTTSREDDSDFPESNDSFTRMHAAPKRLSARRFEEIPDSRDPAFGGTGPAFSGTSLSSASPDDDASYVFPGGLYDSGATPYPTYTKKKKTRGYRQG